MCDSNDNWPMPDYSVGPTKHLHAVGVITTLYNSFESSVCVFFRHHLDLLKVPQKVTEFMFHELNEQKRLEALRLVFTNCEKDPDTLAVILNLLEYFQWCWDARNKLAHAEHYPKSFGRLTDELNLTKQISKRNPTRGYITLDLATLRDIANKINRGIRQAARLHIFLRCRDWPREGWPRGYEVYAYEPLPEKLPIPDSLTLSSTPDGNPKRQRKSSASSH